jgi:phosphinothricin acetyltransferase
LATHVTGDAGGEPGVVRLATPDDAAAVQAIYAPVVRETAISFEWDPPSIDEMRSRITTTLEGGLPWLVLARAGDVLGYAYAARHRSRRAYQWSVEVSVYVSSAARRGGVGRTLYGSLFRVLALQRYVNAYAGATLPNAGSVALHTAVGFREVGIYRRVGFKFGAWHDVIWWHRPLAEYTDAPEAPASLAAAQSMAVWREAIDAEASRATPDQA